MKNFSAYPTHAKASEVRLRIPETADLDRILTKVRTILANERKIAKDPAPTVQLDRSSTENALEIVIGFSAPEADLATVRSEIIKATHEALASERQRKPEAA